MQRILLATFLLAVSLTVSAQRVSPQLGSRNNQATQADLTVTALKPATETNNRSVVLDTIFPAALTLECAEPTLFSSDTSGTLGYVTGSNQFADFEKLQRITLPEAVDVTINQAVVAFAVVEDSIDNRDIVVNIYTDLGPDGSFGQLVGSSDTLKVSDLITNDSALVFTTFNFSEPAILEAASSFLLSVDVSGVYFNENDEFDPKGNVGVFSTPAGCGDGTNLFEIFPNDQGGLSFNSVFANWGMLNIEMYVGAVVDRGTFTSTRPAATDYNAAVFPNPVADELSISFTAPAGGAYTARVVSTTGAIIRSQEVRTVAGATQVTLPVADLPSGIYLFQVAGADGVQTGKFVKR